MNNVIELDVKTNNWYKNLKKVSFKHLNMEVVEGEVKGEPIKTRQNLQKLINIVTINKNYDLYDKIHWLLGLMLSVYCKQYKVGKLHADDMNYIGSIMWHKYSNDSLVNETPKNKELCDKVLDQFEEWLKEA